MFIRINVLMVECTHVNSLQQLASARHRIYPVLPGFGLRYAVRVG